MFYRLAVAGTIPNTAAAYRKLSAHLAEARRRGPYPELIDNVRQIHLHPTYDDPAALLAQVPDLYRRDRTEGQAELLVLAAEKDTLRAQMLQWVSEYGLPTLVLRGFSSQTYVTRVCRFLADDNRPAILGYVGDLDASGSAILTDWLARTDGCWTGLEHIAVTPGQVTAYNLPPAPGKSSDPRWPAFAERHGLDPDQPVQWEAEAIDPAELHRLVMDTVARHTDQAVFQRALDREERELRSLRRFLDDWPDSPSS